MTVESITPTENHPAKGNTMAELPIQALYLRIADKLLEIGIPPADHVKSMASASGLNLNAVYKWRKGESRDCSIFHIQKICAKYGLDMNWIAGTSMDKPLSDAMGESTEATQRHDFTGLLADDDGPTRRILTCDSATNISFVSEPVSSL